MPKRSFLVTLCLFFASLAAGAQVIYGPTPRPHQNFVDLAGNPCNGCSLYTYLAGTTTNAPTWTDATGLTQNQNPIVLDAAGGANIWLSSTVTYKFALYENGALQWTVDQVPGAGTSSNTGLPLAGGTLTGPIAWTGGPFATPANTTLQNLGGWAITPSLSGVPDTVESPLTTFPGPSSPGLAVLPDGNLISIYAANTPQGCYGLHSTTCTPTTVTKVSYDGGNTWPSSAQISFPSGYTNTGDYQSITTLSNGTLFLLWSLNNSSTSLGVPYYSIGTISNAVANYTTSVSQPEGVITDSSGNVYIANFGSNSVTKYNSSGAFQWNTGLSGGTGPEGIALDPVSGDVLTANSTSNSVSVITAGGSFVRNCTVGTAPQGVAADSSGHIWVADYGVTGTSTPGDVKELTSVSSCTVLQTITQPTVGNNPSAILIGPSTRIYVSNQYDGTVSVLNSSGAALSNSPCAASAGVTALALDGSENVYASGASILGFAPTTCSPVSSIASGGGVLGIAIDPNGFLWGTNNTAATVTKYNVATGTVLGTFAMQTSPIGIAISTAGQAWIGNFGSNSISSLSTTAVADSVSWSTPTQIPNLTTNVSWYVSSPAVQLANGSLLVPIWTQPTSGIDAGAGYMTYTSGTWSSPTILATGIGTNLGYNENAAVQFANGDITMMIRFDSPNEQTGTYYMAQWLNGGTGFGPVSPVLNATTVGRPTLLVLPNQDLLMLGRGNSYNDTYTHMAWLSSNEGVSWGTGAEISIQPGHANYEALALESNGTIASLQATNLAGSAYLSFSTMVAYGFALPQNINLGRNLNLANQTLTNPILVNPFSETAAGSGLNAVHLFVNTSISPYTLLAIQPSTSSIPALFGTYRINFNNWGLTGYGVSGNSQPLLFTFDSSGNLTIAGIYEAGTLGNGFVGTTQTAFDASTKVATDAYADAAATNRHGGTPTCSVTGAGSGASCAVISGSTDNGGVMQITAGTTPSSSGTLTLTFSASSSVVPACTANLNNQYSGGWVTGATNAQVFVNSGTTALETWGWFNVSTALTNTDVYGVNYTCSRK